MKVIDFEKDSVRIQDGDIKVWFDVWESDGELTGDWNQYIFDLTNEKDLAIRKYQENSDNFMNCMDLAIETLTVKNLI